TTRARVAVSRPPVELRPASRSPRPHAVAHLYARRTVRRRGEVQCACSEGGPIVHPPLPGAGVLPWRVLSAQRTFSLVRLFVSGTGRRCARGGANGCGECSGKLLRAEKGLGGRARAASPMAHAGALRPMGRCA